MLILRPPGSGNWAPTVVTIEGPGARPLELRRGMRYVLGDRVYRIVAVYP
jgi:hypothetical protein